MVHATAFFSSTPCSLGLSATSHQYFSQNKPATSNQPAVLFSQNKSAPAISHQPNEQSPKLVLVRQADSTQDHMILSPACTLVLSSSENSSEVV
jgi:hypothetical protein